MILRQAIRAEAKEIPPEQEEAMWDINDLPALFFGDSSGSTKVTRKVAQGLSPVMAAHRILAGAMSVLPVGLYQKIGDARTPVADKALDRVLRIRANPMMSPATIKRTLMSQAYWYGRGHLWIRRDPSTGDVVQLLPLYTPDVKIRKDATIGQYWYECTINGGMRTFDPDELITVLFESYDGIHGRGVLELANDTMSADANAQKYNRKFYSSGAKMSGVVSVDTDLGKEGRDKVKSEFKKYANDDAFTVAVLDRGMSYTPIGVKQADAQFLEGRSFSVAEISRFTGVPECMLQAGKQAYNSNAQQMLAFVTNTLLPHVVQWEQELAYKLLDSDRLLDGHYFRFNLAALLRGDDEARAKFFQAMVFSGLYCPDECRAMDEKNPIPGGLGKKFFMTKNLAPMEEIIGALGTK